MVPRIFNFLLKKRSKKHDGQGKKKIGPAKLNLERYMAERHVMRHDIFYMAAATLQPCHVPVLEAKMLTIPFWISV